MLAAELEVLPTLVVAELEPVTTVYLARQLTLVLAEVEAVGVVSGA